MPDPIIVTKELLEQTFDDAAPYYNDVWHFRENGHRLIDLMAIDPGANVLDIATGTGMVLLPAARRVGPGGNVTGVDISSNMLRQARTGAAREGLANVTLLKMDAEHLEFPDASFDTITCGFGIWFFPPAALREMYRVCKPGGSIGVTVGDKTITEGRRPNAIIGEQMKDWGMEFKYLGPSTFAPEDVETLLTDNGFNHAKTIQETKERVYADAEEFWDRMFSAGLRMYIMNMDDVTRARFKHELLGRLRPIMQPDGLHSSVHVIYSIARK